MLNLSKKVLLVSSNLKPGGITTAFINLVECLKKDNKIDFDILLFDTDDCNKYFNNIKILSGNKFMRMLVVNQSTINSESKMLGLFRLFCGFTTKIWGHGVLYKLLFLTHKKIRGYDCAISFTHSSSKNSLFGGCNEFVLNRVIANEKITFLHCDYSMCGIANNYSKKIYSRFNKIAAVSEGVKLSFFNKLPELNSKTYVVHNCHLSEKIQQLADDNPVAYKTDALNIITVARISAEKGHYRALEAFKKLKSEGVRFYWHIVGGADRNTEAAFQKSIEDAGLSDNVIMHYNQENPYRFFVNADALLLPSYHEAAPMVFSEAEILKLPILTTDTTSAEEFVSSKKIGIVCPNTDEAIYQMLKDVLQKPEMLADYKNNMKTPDNESSLNEFYELING